MATPMLRYEPEKMDNYSPWYNPVPPLEIDDICQEPTICLEVSCAFIPYLVGLLELARWPDRFSGTTEQQEKSAGLFRDLMGEIAMSCGCNGDSRTIVIEHRITITGEWQISIDGGETWTPDPDGIEPKIPSLPPPVSVIAGIDKCQAASWGVEHAQIWKDQYIAQLEEENSDKEKAIAIITGLVDLLLVIAGAFWLTGAAAVLLGLIAAYLAMSPEAFAALFTTEVWDDFLCILLCHMRDDGTFDHNGFVSVINDCETKIAGGFGSTSAALWIQIMVKQIGMKGLNQICAYGSIAPMGCDDCECSGCGFDWVAARGTIIDQTELTVTVEAEEIAPGAWQAGVISPGIEFCCTLTGIDILTEGVSATGSAWDCGSIYPGAGQFFGIITGHNVTSVFAENDAGQPFTVKFRFGGG